MLFKGYFKIVAFTAALTASVMLAFFAFVQDVQSQKVEKTLEGYAQEFIQENVENCVDKFCFELRDETTEKLNRKIGNELLIY